MARDLIAESTLKRWAYVSFFALCFPGDEAETEARLDQVIRGVLPRAMTPELLERVADQGGGAIGG